MCDRGKTLSVFAESYVWMAALWRNVDNCETAALGRPVLDVWSGAGSSSVNIPFAVGPGKLPDSET
jgi:hypothetical protein